MPGGSESLGSAPAYITAHSADVILSDIRPINLKPDALSSINVFLDELLWTILNASRSLTTDKLKTGLLKVLSTPLGKEALLEAEVELRAYWERTSASGHNPPPKIDDEKSFNLEWAFELLRLKCQAYSTLNDTDENPDAESRLNDRLLAAGIPSSPPKQAIVSPAALYLTAILESICEHILSNVGRVAARDSSRTTATVQDLFIGLSEDDAIYGLFKSMKVYEQIETMSRPRRSKSFSRPADKTGGVSRTASPNQDAFSRESSSSAHTRSRMSSDSLSVSAAQGATTSRPSFEKARGIKMFASPNRSSSDHIRPGTDQSEGQNGHKKTDSVLSNGSRNGSRQTLVTSADYSKSKVAAEFEDDDSMQDFDDLMRSGATMKVSLTPDRLKTMEVHNREKGRRESVRLGPTSTGQDTAKLGIEADAAPKRGQGMRRPSLRHVDSIIEEEHSAAVKSSAPDPMASHPPVALASRLRSISTSNADGPKTQVVPRKASFTAVSAPPVQSPVSPQKRERPLPKQLDMSGQPTRTRTVVRNRESLDLDDIMNGSDDDSLPAAPSMTSKSSKAPKSPGVSRSTRDLIDFLAEGPPELPSLPKTTSVASLETMKSGGKQSGLRRMMSKLTRGVSTERLNPKPNGYDDPLSRRPTTTSSLSQASLSSKKSYPNVVVGNRPPRPQAALISPPSSPQPSSDDVGHTMSQSRSVATSRKGVPTWEKTDSERLAPSLTSPIRNSGESSLQNSISSTRSPDRPGSHLAEASAHSSERSEVETSRAKSPRALPAPPTISPKENGSSAPPKSPAERVKPKASNSRQVAGDAQINRSVKAHNTVPFEEEVKDLRCLLATATTADECRLLFDMFLIKGGFQLDQEGPSVPYPSPSPSINTLLPSNDIDLEHSVVELLLGGGNHDMDQESGENRARENGRADDAPVSPPYTPSAKANTDAIHKARQDTKEATFSRAPPVIQMEA